MHLILTGSTGLVGSAVLHHILSLPPTSAAAQKISRISVLSRREQILLLEHPDCPKTNTRTKVDILKHTDFGSYDSEILNKLAENGEDVGVIWALGVSQREVSTDKEYDDITRVYPLEAAKAFSTSLGAEQVNFVYVSGEGATSSPGMFTPMFGKVKGQAEQQLIELMKTEPYSKNLRVYAPRPGGVDAGASVGGQKAVFDVAQHRGFRNSLSYKIMERSILPVIRAGVYKGMHSPTEEMATVLTNLAIGDGEAISSTKVKGVESEGRVIPNIAMRRIAGSVS